MLEMEVIMPRIKDLYMDDIDMILEKIPQGSSFVITKEELETDENVFYIETDDTTLLDEMEDILQGVEREDEEEYYEDFDPDDNFDGLVFEDGEDEE